MGVDIKFLVKAENALSKKIFNSSSVLDMFDIHIERGKSNGKRYIKIWKGDVFEPPLNS